MIVVHDGPSLLLVTQNDHACFSGELLSLWRDDGLPSSPRRDDVVFAAREHDNGWREVDAAPRVDPQSGEPYGFLELPVEHRIELWRRGVRRFRERRPYAALLIHEHALALHRSHGGTEPADPVAGSVAELVSELERSRAELLAEIGTDEEALAADYELVRVADLLSLMACRCFAETQQHGGRRFRREEDDLEIVPFPLAGTTRFGIPCRRVERRPYRSDGELAAALAAARWESLAIRVRGG